MTQKKPTTDDPPPIAKDDLPPVEWLDEEGSIGIFIPNGMPQPRDDRWVPKPRKVRNDRNDHPVPRNGGDDDAAA
jgi:hypothetical protein